MDITRRSDYACRILRAAYKSKDAYTSVSKIAEEEDIPYAFARSIQHDLLQFGLIKTTRGANGGLALNCNPAEVNLFNILDAVQGPLSIAACVNDPDICDKQEECEYHQIWCGADNLLKNYFSSITLAEVFEAKDGH